MLDAVLERKSTADLVSSILDKSKRYEKQKYYLKRCGLRRVYYLIEGDPDLMPTEQQQKMVRTAGARIEVHDGITVLRTADHHTTFRLYQRLTCHLQDAYRDTTGSGGTGAGQLPTYAAWTARCKANAEGTATLHDLWGMMLGAVPSMGPEFVQAVLGRYPTPLSLYTAYQEVSAAAAQRNEDGHRAAERLLYGLKADTAGARAIGPDRAAAVYKHLFRQRVATGGGGL